MCIFMQTWTEEAEGEAWWTSEESQCLYVKENKVSSTQMFLNACILLSPPCIDDLIQL